MSQTELIRRQQAFVHCNCLLRGAALVSAGSCELLQAMSQKLLLAPEMTPEEFSVHLSPQKANLLNIYLHIASSVCIFLPQAQLLTSMQFWILLLLLLKIVLWGKSPLLLKREYADEYKQFALCRMKQHETWWLWFWGSAPKFLKKTARLSRKSLTISFL